ncbi:hypothetical protein H072_8304 [Dactylellina haptotyla CBS 200.50]|uniref:Uncharacterized protein n=1 Tax=Dactylellina haptotyla (strain CBS 200.50) TaxID=1284197 RepID=S8BFC2_DACHA|nr:hypothetical protein H072_8304 [Dactylellina haptotyla CBS 200.50]
MATETRATLEDFNLSFPSGLKRLNLRFETFTSHLITPVDLIPMAFGPSKDTLEFFQVSLNELTFHRIRRSGRVRTNIPRWERLYHKDLTSSSLKELRFGCVTSQDVLDPQRAFLPFADIGGMWPKLEKIYYIVNGPWNNDAALQAFRHLATLTYLKELSLFSPRSYGWWNAGGTALEDMSDRVLRYGADLPHSLKVIRFYARTYPPPQGFHAQVVYKPVEVYISRNRNILEVEKSCWGTQIGNIFFPREWGYDLGERR